MDRAVPDALPDGALAPKAEGDLLTDPDAVKRLSFSVPDGIPAR